MLQSLHVKNLALIEEIEVEFGRGLNILTGETGAGKSIILGSVNLALGGRYTGDMIREGASYGYVELGFTVENGAQERALAELDIFPEDGMVVLSRRLMEGRSVSRVNGETVAMSVLRAAAAVLIDIHGQHEHQSLLYKKNHLGILDAYAGEKVRPLKEETARAYGEYRALARELAENDMDESRRAKEMDFLRFEVEEIEGARLRGGEDEELEKLFTRMENAKRLAQSAALAYERTSAGEESASESLSRAIRALSEASACDEQAQELCGRLTDIDALLNDLNRDLSEYMSSLEFSEEEYHETETRLNEINRLKTKYGKQVSDILAYGEGEREKLERLENHESYIAGLKEKLRKAEAELESRAGALTRERKAQAVSLAQAIEEGLKDLNFADVRFETAVTELKSCTPEGADDVEFLISLNPGQPLRPLANVASGGELSRIMLAIKAVMAERDEIETLIFDEIDAGISGRTAQKVSEKMALIGRDHQVICITHLAQIAAMADCHYLIEKTVRGTETTTGIRRLREEESVEELARLLGGARITDAVMENAREMRALAKEKK